MRIFEFVCANGHKVEDLFRSDETVPESIPCETCGGDVVMERVNFYATKGFCMPSGSGSYNQGF
jgi:hypothetical protein